MNSLLSAPLIAAMKDLGCIQSDKVLTLKTLLHSQAERDWDEELPPEYKELLLGWKWPLDEEFALKELEECPETISQFEFTDVIFDAISFLGNQCSYATVPGSGPGPEEFLIIGGGSEYSYGIHLTDPTPAAPTVYLFVETDFDNQFDDLQTCSLSDLLLSLMPVEE